MEIDTNGLNSLEFHAYANRLYDEAYNMLLEYLTKEEIEGRDYYVQTYTTIMSSLISLKESMEGMREGLGEDSKYYKTLADSMRSLMVEILLDG